MSDSSILEAADGRAVETEPILEDALAQLRDGDGEVLPQARQVDEPQIDDADTLLLRQLEYFLGSHPITSSMPCVSDERL
jgi:hypothetical protein